MTFLERNRDPILRERSEDQFCLSCGVTERLKVSSDLEVDLAPVKEHHLVADVQSVEVLLLLEVGVGDPLSLGGGDHPELHLRLRVAHVGVKVSPVKPELSRVRRPRGQSAEDGFNSLMHCSPMINEAKRMRRVKPFIW